MISLLVGEGITLCMPAQKKEKQMQELHYCVGDSN